MKILLLGEYSGAHSNLKDALVNEGHEVTIVSDGDSYKKFKSDYYIKYYRKTSKFKFINHIFTLYYVALEYSGLKGLIQIRKHIDYLRQLKNYDVVQLINPIFLSDFGSIVNYMVFNYIKKNNKKVFLSALGDDYYWVNYCLKNNYKYSIFDRLNFRNIATYLYSLKYVYGVFYPLLNRHIAKEANAIIPGVYDYYAPYRVFKHCTEVVPLIVNNNISKSITPSYTSGQKINIFHGWQPGKEVRKGNDIFDNVAKRIVKEFGSKVSYEIVSGLPYSEYIKKFNDSHIFLDQCYSQGMGVNALLGMEAGKVVFSGFERPLQESLNLNYKPLINAIPDEDYLYNEIVKLIDNPSLINEYSRNAKKFIETFHSPKYVLKKYYAIWSKY